MTVLQMKNQISKVYDGQKWKDRVQRMSDNQVIAVYNSFLSSGKMNQKSTRLPGERFHQMTLFECGLKS